MRITVNMPKRIAEGPHESHSFFVCGDPEDGEVRCGDCDSRPGGAAATWPCGTTPERVDVYRCDVQGHPAVEVPEGDPPPDCLACWADAMDRRPEAILSALEADGILTVISEDDRHALCPTGRCFNPATVHECHAIR